jgi:hypothetical protein
MLSTRIQPDVVFYGDTGKMFATDAERRVARRGPTLEYWEADE